MLMILPKEQGHLLQKVSYAGGGVVETGGGALEMLA